MTLLLSAAFAVAVGVLAFSVVAKVTDWPETSATWPVVGRARRLAGPGPVTVLEAAVVAVALVPLPVAARLMAIGLVYAAYTAVAVALRGRRCACFGAAAHTTFTVRHAVLCGLLAAVVLVGTAAGGGPDPGPASAVAAAAIGAGVVAGLVAGRRRRAAQADRALPGRPEQAVLVVVLGDDGCPVCSALWQQRTELHALAACDVELRYADSDEERRLAGGAYPAAVGYDDTGAVVAGPVWGPVDIRRLLGATEEAPDTAPDPVADADADADTDARAPGW